MSSPISNEPVNQVDVSGATIKAEWEAIALSINYDDSEPESGFSDTGENPEALEGEYQSSEEVKKEYKDYTPEEISEAEEAMTGALQGSFNFVLGVMQIEYIDQSCIDEFCERWAVVIVKRWPSNPVGAFHAEYKDLIGAGMSTVVLIGAIRTGRKASVKEVEQTVNKGLEGVEDGA